MSTIAQTLQNAVRLHQTGDFASAERLYQEVLRAEPENFDALHLLGLVLHQTGHSNPAIERLQQALTVRPQSADAHYNLGNILRELRRPSEAAAAYQRAVQLRQNYPEAYYNLGNALNDLRQYAAAIDCYRRAAAQRPGYIKALNNLGNACLDLGRPAEALEAYQQTVRLNPQYAKGYNNLGNALRQLGRLQESADHCRKALELEPDNPESLNNLAAALLDLGEVNEALATFDQAIIARADYAEAHMNRGMAWLLTGDYERGWAEYEWRWRSKSFTPRPFEQPAWDGSDPSGRTILVHAEQGLGDTLNFIRYVPRLAERGAQVVLECPPALHRLLSEFAGVERLIKTDEPPPAFDFHVPLLSLPHLLGLSDPAQAAVVPYLFADDELRRMWRRELADLEGFKVGINWQGNRQHPKDRQRSIPLALFRPLFEVPGIQWISLQKGYGIEQLESLPERERILELGSRLDETSGAFRDTAAVVSELDLVITSDTALAHLAGALGAPVWLALSTAPDWRWQLTGDTTPWYPTMRLFRQPRQGDWASVFAEAAAALRDRAV
jgi:tetratricopeptide (TPR) repeat protein